MSNADHERWVIANWCDAKGRPGPSFPTPPPEPLSGMEFPWGVFTVWADDDDVIGQKVAQSYPSGLHIIQTNPPHGLTCDDADVAAYLAWALTNRSTIIGDWQKNHPVAAAEENEQG